MSFYTVDAPAMNPSHGDLGYGNQISTESFPMAQPSGQAYNLNRQPTSASTYSANTPAPQGDVSFPVPLTAPPVPQPISAGSNTRQGVDSPLPSGVGMAK